MSHGTEQLSEADDELLTSYLDQELPPDERYALERRLVDDEPLRKKLAAMRRAWDLLDELPETPFTPNFTQSTLEMVAIDLEKEKERAEPLIGIPLPRWVPRPSPRVRLAVVVGSAMLVGGLAGIFVRNRSISTEAKEIALAARLPTLQEFPKLESLKELTTLPGWKTLLETDAIRGRVLTALPDSSDRPAIEQYVNRLDAQQKEILWSRKQSLEKMSPSEIKQLSDRYDHAIVVSGVDDDLQKMATLLTGVLQSVTMTERAELRNLPEDIKLARLKEEVCFQLSKLLLDKLTPAERVNLQRWKVQELIPQLRSNLAFVANNPENSNPDGLIFGALYFAMRNGNTTINGQEALIDSLCKGMSESTVTIIRGMSNRHQLSMIESWATERRIDLSKAPAVDELYRYYQELDPKRREELDLKRLEDVRRYLESRSRRGLGDRFGPRGGAFGGSEGPNGPRPGGPDSDGPNFGPGGPGDRPPPGEFSPGRPPVGGRREGNFGPASPLPSRPREGSRAVPPSE
jgi:hypothetical protein